MPDNVAHSTFFSNSSTIPNFGLFLEQAMNPHKDSKLRVPFYLTSSWRRRKFMRGVAMLVNPTTVSFRQDKRTTERDTQEGKVFFHWATQAGTNDDVLRMEFNGQTGNINIRTGTRGQGVFGASQGASDFGNWLSSTLSDISGSNNWEDPGTLRVMGANIDTSGASKLANLHNLWSLTREPVLDVVTGSPVYYYITYASPLFGNSLITFIGHFSRPLEITDDASNPFNKRYSFGFVAHGSYPSPAHLYATILQNLSQTFINAIGG
jgi:hypothetical protein